MAGSLCNSGMPQGSGTSRNQEDSSVSGTTHVADDLDQIKTVIYLLSFFYEELYRCRVGKEPSRRYIYRYHASSRLK